MMSRWPRAQALGKVSEKRRVEEINKQARTDLLARVHGKYDDAHDQLLELETALAQVERDRVLYRMLGNTSDHYVKAYYERLKYDPQRPTSSRSWDDELTPSWMVYCDGRWEAQARHVHRQLHHEPGDAILEQCTAFLSASSTP
jgi:hypothetical protein